MLGRRFLVLEWFPVCMGFLLPSQLIKKLFKGKFQHISQSPCHSVWDSMPTGFRLNKWLSEETTNKWGKKISKRQGRKGKIYPTECRVPENSKERWEGFLNDQFKEENNSFCVLGTLFSPLFYSWPFSTLTILNVTIPTLQKMRLWRDEGIW